MQIYFFVSEFIDPSLLHVRKRLNKFCFVDSLSMFDNPHGFAATAALSGKWFRAIPKQKQKNQPNWKQTSRGELWLQTLAHNRCQPSYKSKYYYSSRSLNKKKVFQNLGGLVRAANWVRFAWNETKFLYNKYSRQVRVWWRPKWFWTIESINQYRLNSCDKFSSQQLPSTHIHHGRRTCSSSSLSTPTSTAAVGNTFIVFGLHGLPGRFVVRGSGQSEHCPLRRLRSQ